MYKLVEIQKSYLPNKKLTAIFINVKTGRNKVVHFGAAGMSDFTIHKDEERKERYIQRHKSRENWNNPISAGALSRFILWNKPTLEESIKDYKKRFNL